MSTRNSDSKFWVGTSKSNLPSQNFESKVSTRKFPIVSLDSEVSTRKFRLRIFDSEKRVGSFGLKKRVKIPSQNFWLECYFDSQMNNKSVEEKITRTRFSLKSTFYCSLWQAFAVGQSTRISRVSRLGLEMLRLLAEDSESDSDSIFQYTHYRTRNRNLSPKV